MVRPHLSIVATLLALGLAMPADAVASDLERDVLREINHARVAHHRGRLGSHGGLRRAARRHSRAMARRGVLAHAPDWARPLKRVTPRARVWAENLAWVSIGSAVDVARRTVTSWLHSPPHRHNLLLARVDVVGLGAVGGRGGEYVTADFAGR